MIGKYADSSPFAVGKATGLHLLNNRRRIVTARSNSKVALLAAVPVSINSLAVA
jgi:hypothetical protein